MKIKQIPISFVLAAFAFATISAAQGEGPFSMSGSFDNGRATGVFSQGFADGESYQPLTFIGSNNRVYRAVLIGEKLSELNINGVKTTVERIADDREAEKKLAAFIEMRREMAQLEREEIEIDKAGYRINSIARSVGGKARSMDLLEDKLDRDRDALETALETKDEKKLSALRRSVAEKERELEQLRSELEVSERELEERSDMISRRAEYFASRAEAYGDMYRREIDEVLSRILDELRNAGVVSGAGKPSFKLSNRELIVNGRKADQTVFERLRNVFVGDATGGVIGFMYNWKIKS